MMVVKQRSRWQWIRGFIGDEIQLWWQNEAFLVKYLGFRYMLTQNRCLKLKLLHCLHSDSDAPWFH
jgi:hypothetical protein